MPEQLSRHAIKRLSQRNIHMVDVSFVLQFGIQVHNGGALFVFLGSKNIPTEFQADDRIAKLEGTTLVMSRDGCLITAYRNKNALREIRKKNKSYRR